MKESEPERRKAIVGLLWRAEPIEDASLRGAVVEAAEWVLRYQGSRALLHPVYIAYLLLSAIAVVAGADPLRTLAVAAIVTVLFVWASGRFAHRAKRAIEANGNSDS